MFFIKIITEAIYSQNRSVVCCTHDVSNSEDRKRQHFFHNRLEICTTTTEYDPVKTFAANDFKTVFLFQTNNK